MTALRILGAALIVCGSAGFGFGAAGQLRRTLSQLRQLDTALHLMDCELRFISPPLPRLMRSVAKDTEGPVSMLFSELAKRLSDPATASTEQAMRQALNSTKRLCLPAGTVFGLLEFSETLGRYDLSGQLAAIASFKERNRRQIEAHLTEQKARCRTYEALGLCTGLAVVILIV